MLPRIAMRGNGGGGVCSHGEKRADGRLEKIAVG